MEIGGLRVVASPVRVHWGREGRSEVRVPDGGGGGVSTLTGRTPPPHRRRGQAQLLPALPGPLCDPRAASPWGGPPVLRPCPHLLRVGASSSRRCQGGDCPRLKPHPQPRAPQPPPQPGRPQPTARPGSPGGGAGMPGWVGVFPAPSAGAGLLVGGVTAALCRGASCPTRPRVPPTPPLAPLPECVPQ